MNINEKLNSIFDNLYIWDYSAEGAVKIEKSLTEAKQQLLALFEERRQEAPDARWAVEQAAYLVAHSRHSPWTLQDATEKVIEALGLATEALQEGKKPQIR